MEDYKHRQQADLQHLAYLRQQSQTPSDHNPWQAEVGLEAHLVQHQRRALAAIQDLERQRLHP